MARKAAKIGLTLGSGGARGLSHIAVLEFLSERQVPINCIAGASIGALIGAVYAFGKLNEFKEQFIALETKDLISFVDPVLPKHGLIKGRKTFQALEEFIPADADIEDSPIPLAIAATELRSGACVMFRRGNLHLALNASIAIPGVFTPVAIDDGLYVDGGVANPLPIDLAKKLGADRVIAVNLHGRGAEGVDYTAPFSERVAQPTIEIALPEEEKPPWYKRLMPATRATNNDLPLIHEVISQTLNIAHRVYVRDMLSRHPPDLLIEPDVHGITTMDFLKIERALEAGREACENIKPRALRKLK